MQNSDDKLKKIISHCKEYGYVFPSSEIYDGLSATYDYGQYGSELKNNIKEYWWKAMTRLHENIVGIAEPVAGLSCRAIVRAREALGCRQTPG